MMALFLVVEVLALLLQRFIVGTLDNIFIQHLRFEAEKNGNRLAAQPVCLLVDPVADNDQPEQNAHNAGNQEDTSLHQQRHILLGQGEGDQKREHSQIQ